MTINGWFQIGLVFALVALCIRPLGLYMADVFDGKRISLNKYIYPLERTIYRAAGINETHEQSWLGYTLSMLIFSGVGFVSLYLILRTQSILPLNPQGFDNLTPDLAFNTSISFLTNTDWQAYSGETTMSHFSQMVGLTVHNFLSAATGIALALAVTRSFSRSESTNLGNFWVDLTRATLYVLLPLSAIVAIIFVALGVPQTLSASLDITTLEGIKQTIAIGPIASQEAIKQIGTNGGGFFNANSAHPFENPNAISNIISIWAMLVIPCALPITFGRLVGSERQGWTLLAVMAILLMAAVLCVYYFESAGNPLITSLGVDPSLGNMEGKELRFGQALSALFVVVTTGLSCGAVNTMHDSLMPMAGFMPMFLIHLGEVLPGGVGSGLYGILIFALLAVFIAGLMVGRTPEFLGKKIEAREIKLAMLAVLILPMVILGFSSIAALLPDDLSSLGNNGPHGLSEILYAYTSAAGNNGSAFAGLNANTLWYNTTLGISMILGRFGYVLPVMAIAGSLVSKSKLPVTAGTFPTDTPLFVGLMIGVILILGGLQFFPSLALGPIVEHVLMLAGHTY